MTRLAIPAREDMPAERQHFYDRILLSRGQVSGPYQVLLNSPDVATRIANVGDFILYDSILKPSVKYLAMLVAATGLKADYIWDSVLPHARRAGVSPAVLDALAAGAVPQPGSREEALVLTYCTKLLTGNHHVDDETHREVVEHFGVQAAVQIAYTVGYCIMLGLITNAFEVEYDPSESQIIL